MRGALRGEELLEPLAVRPPRIWRCPRPARRPEQGARELGLISRGLGPQKHLKRLPHDLETLAARRRVYTVAPDLRLREYVRLKEYRPGLDDR